MKPRRLTKTKMDGLAHLLDQKIDRELEELKASNAALRAELARRNQSYQQKQTLDTQ